MTKHARYAIYLLRHKWFVFVAGLKTKAPLWRLIVHDWSKFLPCEWSPYAEYFYGPGVQLHYLRPERSLQAEFDAAWLHHQHFNPHHWQHWVLREDSGATKILEMPEHFIREMAADWMGAGRAITGKWGAWDWYQKNQEHIQIAPATRERVEYWLMRATTSGLRETARVTVNPSH